jgi:hypothetical protein
VFDNRIIPFFIFHVVDWLLNGDLMGGGTLMQRKIVIPTVLLMFVLAGGGAFAFLHGSAEARSKMRFRFPIYREKVPWKTTRSIGRMCTCGNALS